MSAPKDGGPAFPIADQHMAHDVAMGACIGIENSGDRDKLYVEARAAAVRGMTLRDYFAAKAMAGDLAGDPPNNWSQAAEARAKCYYEMADAMLKAREAQP